MSNNQVLTTKSLFSQMNVQERFRKLLGKKAQGFITSVLQVVGDNKLLKDADPTTVLNAAATAASLDLPINPNLGFAYLVPYRDNKAGKTNAQFQIGWRGFVQLAQRTGQYKRINVIEVYENQFKGFNQLTEFLDADFNIKGEGKIVGYAAFFLLSTGFEKLDYWSVERVTEHAMKYSKSFNSATSAWKTTFHAMAKKTVLKNIISKWGVMSIELNTAKLADQSVQIEEGQYNYIDNGDKGIDFEEIDDVKEKARCLEFMKKAKTLKELQKAEKSVDKLGLRDDYDLLAGNFAKA